MIPTRNRIAHTLVSAATLAAMLFSAGAVFGAGPEASREPLVYLLNAHALGDVQGSVPLRFELWDEYRLIATETLHVRFHGEDALVLPIPSFLSAALAGVERKGLVLEVFAGDRLVESFDMSALAGYQRVLRNTRRPELEALADAFGVGGPGKPMQKIFCQSPCEGGCGPLDDYDCDGVNNMTDNCTDDSNSNQADCDNDGYGDVCDVTDGIFQATGPVETCMADKDSHFGWTEFEHHVEQRLVDVSSCNSPDRWSRWIRSNGGCCDVPPCGSGYSDQACCINTIGTSIEQVGDSEALWCGSQRNQDLCQ